MKWKMMVCLSVFVLLCVNTVFADAIFPVSTGVKSAACPATPSYYSSDFCTSFPPVAVCQCKELGPAGACTSAQQAYDTMIKWFNTIPRGCQYAIDHGVISDLKTCIDRWECFENGGTYDGHQCQGNGQACPH